MVTISNCPTGRSWIQKNAVIPLAILSVRRQDYRTGRSRARACRAPIRSFVRGSALQGG
jgi:hypothetical protein